MYWHKRLVTMAMALLIAVGVSGVVPAASSAQERGLESLKQTGQAFRNVAKKVSPAVVFIKVEKEVSSQGTTEFYSPFGSPFDDEFFRRFFGAPPGFENPHRQQPQKRRQAGQGSGFLITPDGYIITNNHVVGDADLVSVQMNDGREYEAEIVGTDPGSDLAVIKIDESDLPFLKLGSSEKLEVGDWVLAVGNPFGLSHTLTAGVVSAKGRSGIGLNDYEDFIQTDAAINPGNSGGPLVNLDGEVVGINTAIFSRSGGYMGIGFAIPVDMAKNIKSQLIEHGEVKRGRLGVYIQDMTPDLAESFGLDEVEGILVTQVIEDSPAEDAGLKQGDVILQIDGDKLDKVASFRNRIALTAPGTKVSLLILRDGKEMTFKVKIGKQTERDNTTSGSRDIPEIGLTLQDLTPELEKRFGYENEEGVLVTGVDRGSLAERAGIRQGSLILEIGRKKVTSVQQAKTLLKENKRDSILLLVKEGDGLRYIAIKTNPK
ncbi:MAG: serine protease Do [Desulfuromonadales bacterium]|nr:serine protease Do [Desulfuromonadales bacterium]